MSEATTYKGGCHCGAVRYEVTTDLSQVIYCNCSMCAKTGTWLAFVPENQFKLESGEDNLSDYQFNKKIIHHLFCKTCGIRSFGRGKGPNDTPMVAINVRCLDDIDLENLKPVFYDGKNR
ncbi:GFA family protein [Candidatus Peregrinibacteria bacterium]|nr:GFA family protein [Candidatus Peregrinibacteria bacterium]